MDLTSHHVNYLIWRYLQESGHGEAAVMLQRAWNPNPQSLPFAPYIEAHALVTLVQKGLQYHEIEQTLDQDGNSMSSTPTKNFFGPEPLRPELLKSRDDQSRETDGLPKARPSLLPETKVEADGNVINGHAIATEPVPQVLSSKKRRKSGPIEPPDAVVNGGEEGAMEIETNGITHDFASALAKSPFPADIVDADGDVGMIEASDVQNEEQALVLPPTLTLTSGRSVGVQTTPAKAADLGPNTVVLEVAGGDHVVRTVWRPNDPSVIAIMGDAFWGLWKLSGHTSSPSSAPIYEKLVERKNDGTCVSAIAWDPTGQKLAVATYNDLSGSVTTYNIQGNAVDLLPNVPRMITGLHWADKGSRMVIVASDGKISELALWDDSTRADQLPPPQVIDGPVYDLAWSGDSQVYACGDGAVFRCDVDSSIHLSGTFSSGGLDTAWTFIQCTGKGAPSAAVVASSASASIWVPTHDIHLEAAHHGEITAIALRPQPQSSELQPDAGLVLASSSIDETVKIWHVDLDSRRLNFIHRLLLGPSLPALASVFSPDGYAIAAASNNKVFIWSVERGGTPLAIWGVPRLDNVKDESHDQAINGENGVSKELLDRCLSWDSDGKKVALGFGNRMAMINLQR